MNQVVEHGKYTKEQLLAMSGQTIGGNKDFISNLYINKNIKDKDGNKLPVGTFTFEGPEKDKDGNKIRLYATSKDDTILFRPYIKCFRYEAYDSAADNGKGANVGRTILFTDFKQEIIADNGLLKAGAKSNSLPETTKVKCKIYIYGTVTLDAVNGKGETVKVVDHPVFIKLGGKNFLEYDALFKEMQKQNKFIFLYDLKLTPAQTQTGAFVANVEWNNLTAEYPINDVVISILENFNTYIGVENKRIENKWKRIVDKAAKPGETADPIVADTANDSLELPQDGEDIVDG